MPKKLTNKERDNLIVELHNLQTSMNAAGILGGSPRTLTQLERRREEIQSMLENEHVPAARKRKADEGDVGGVKKRRPMVKKMTDADIREEIGVIERMPTTGTDRSRLAALREEIERRQHTEGAGNHQPRAKSPEFHEVVDDSSDDSDSSDDVVVIDDDDAGESFGPIVIELERRPDESPLVYLGRLVRVQDSLEDQLNRMNQEMDRMRHLLSVGKARYNDDLSRVQHQLAAASGFSEERRLQEDEYELTVGEGLRRYQREMSGLTNDVDRLKDMYQKQFRDLDVLTSRIQNVRVRAETRRALMQEFPDMSLTDQTEAFRARFVKETPSSFGKMCNLEVFIKKYLKKHPGTSYEVMEKKYKRACTLHHA